MKVDMSPRAITNRLEQVSNLRRLCLSLGKATPVPPAADKEKKKPPPNDQHGNAKANT